MADEANNNGQNSGNEGNNSQSQVDTASSSGGVDNIDPTISKHLDMAIEAQDGKPDAQTATKTGEKKEGDDNSGQPNAEAGESGTGDDGAQKKPSKEASEAARTLNRAKDLTLKGQGPDGTDLVIKGGAERRFYEQLQTTRQQVQHEQGLRTKAENDLRALTEQFNALDASIKITHGIDAHSLSAGARIVTDLQRDPVGTLKKLVAEAAARGYDTKDLGTSIDTASIMRMIDERTPKQTATQTDEQIRAEAEKEVASFYTQFPDAHTHDSLIARVLQDHPDETLSSVYFKLKSEFIDKGFDWNKSLEDNLAALQASDPNNTNGSGNNNQQNNSNNAPLPTGGNGGNDGEFRLNKDTASASDDTGDIVREAMREAGMNI